MLKLLLFFIYFLLIEKLYSIFSSIYYGFRCKHNCDKCKMWSCTYLSDNKVIDTLFDDYSNTCGKVKLLWFI